MVEVDAPVHSIKTARLLIRSLRDQDAIPLSRIFSNEFSSRHEPRKPKDPSVDFYRGFIAECRIADMAKKSAFMAIEILDQPANIIGLTGFNNLRSTANGTEIGESDAPIGDLGIIIDEPFLRKGYAMEALTALIDYGFDVLGCQSMFAQSLARNVPCRAVFAKLGLEQYEQVQTQGIFGEEVEWIFTYEQWKHRK